MDAFNLSVVKLDPVSECDVYNSTTRREFIEENKYLLIKKRPTNEEYLVELHGWGSHSLYISDAPEALIEDRCILNGLKAEDSLESTLMPFPSFSHDRMLLPFYGLMTGDPDRVKRILFWFEMYKVRIKINYPKLSHIEPLVDRAVKL